MMELKIYCPKCAYKRECKEKDCKYYKAYKFLKKLDKYIIEWYK